MLAAGKGGCAGAEVQTVPGAWLDGSGNMVLWRNGQIHGRRGEDAGKNCRVSSESLVLPDHKSTELAGSIPQPKAVAAGAHGEFGSPHAGLGPV